jgi:hypothetical protein
MKILKRKSFQQVAPKRKLTGILNMTLDLKVTKVDALNSCCQMTADLILTSRQLMERDSEFDGSRCLLLKNGC